MSYEDNVIPMIPGRKHAADSVTSELEALDAQEQAQADAAALEATEAELVDRYAKPGTQAGGPKSLLQKLQERAAEMEAALTQLHQASEDPENDEELAAAASAFATLLNEIEALEAQQAPTVDWNDLSTDEKLDALAQAMVEVGLRQNNMAQKLTQFGQVLYRILLKAGEINEDGTPVVQDGVKRSEGGVVLPE